MASFEQIENVQTIRVTQAAKPSGGASLPAGGKAGQVLTKTQSGGETWADIPMQDISGKLDAAALPAAVDDALAKAKASGEFDGPAGPAGPAGERGPAGETGAAGKDGVSVTHSWSGTTLSITSASGTTSADLRGPQGEQGPAGPTGEQGPAGPAGERGETGATGPQGETGATGATGATGPAGYTPVRGTDYWTAADIAEIKGYVDDAILGGAW